MGMEFRIVAPGVFVTQGEMVNAGIVVGEERTLVVDTMMRVTQATSLEEKRRPRKDEERRGRAQYS